MTSQSGLEPMQRFTQKVNSQGDGCHVWIAARDPKGYLDEYVRGGL